MAKDPTLADTAIPEVDIVVEPNPFGGLAVLVDGHDIANHVTALTVTAGVSVGQEHPARISLTVELLDQRAALRGRGIFGVAPSTRQALIAAGWTPPPGEQ